MKNANLTKQISCSACFETLLEIHLCQKKEKEILPELQN